MCAGELAKKGSQVDRELTDRGERGDGEEGISRADGIDDGCLERQAKTGLLRVT